MARSSSSISVIEVAQPADVSAGTVSRVFNRHPAISSDLRRRVLKSSRQLGYSPKIAHKCVGIVTGRHSPSFPVGIMTSLVSRMLSDKRLLVELIDIESLDLVYEIHVDGVTGIIFDERITELTSIPKLPIVY